MERNPHITFLDKAPVGRPDQSHDEIASAAGAHK